jgi:hypothetical protein
MNDISRHRTGSLPLALGTPSETSPSFLAVSRFHERASLVGDITEVREQGAFKMKKDTQQGAVGGKGRGEQLQHGQPAAGAPGRGSSMQGAYQDAKGGPAGASQGGAPRGGSRVEPSHQQRANKKSASTKKSGKR